VEVAKVDHRFEGFGQHDSQVFKRK